MTFASVSNFTLCCIGLPATPSLFYAQVRGKRDSPSHVSHPALPPKKIKSLFHSLTTNFSSLYTSLIVVILQYKTHHTHVAWILLRHSLSMGGSPGDVSEEPVMYKKQKKSWRMSCDVCEATEELENELQRK